MEPAQPQDAFEPYSNNSSSAQINKSPTATMHKITSSPLRIQPGGESPVKVVHKDGRHADLLTRSAMYSSV